MGLDVTVHKNVKLAKTQDYDELAEICDEQGINFFMSFVIEDSWLNRISDLENRKLYISEDAEWTVGYAYSYHSTFRRMICTMMGISEDSWLKDKLPIGSDFEEFLNFADNEGGISKTTAKKLWLDFEKWKEKAQTSFDESFIHNYNKWLYTFKEAAENNGYVEYR